MRDSQPVSTAVFLRVLAFGICLAGGGALGLFLTGCTEADPAAPGDPIDETLLAGGGLTVFAVGPNAFSHPAPNLGATLLADHNEGRAQFSQAFVPAQEPGPAGLGPLFNNSSCVGCHPSHGRGRPPLYSPERLTSMLVLISAPGTDAHGGPLPVPGFGLQLQQRALIGLEAEGTVAVHWTEHPGSYADGAEYSLRKTILVATGTVPSDVLMSPRIAPPLIGLGLLEAVDEQTILQLSDEFDLDGDSISGRPNYVWDSADNRMMIGRFGWKAGQPTLLQQNALAFNEDIGITNPYYPSENCTGSPVCDSLDDDPELSERALLNMTTFMQTLGVPARRNATDRVVAQGYDLFKTVRCSSCHVERLTTGDHASHRELSRQTIIPFTDLLLHDMGEELADERPEFSANGREWRTAPLWGIGQTADVGGGLAFYLHDGRARSLEEAILWHGGEGSRSRELFRQLSSTDRAALLSFLQSL